MKLCFLDRFDPQLDMTDSKIVSLSPGASYELSKRRIEYTIIEDYYDESDLQKDVKDGRYFYDQLSWFDAFDGFLKKYRQNTEFRDIPLIKSNYLRVAKVIDTLIIFSYTLKHFFEKNPNLEEIVFVCEGFKGEAPSVFQMRHANRKIFSDVLTLFCKKKDIKLSVRLFGESEQFVANNCAKETGVKALLSRFGIKHQVKNILNYMKYEKYSGFIRRDKLIVDRNFLFMHAGGVDVDEVLIETLQSGASVYILDGNNILCENGFFRKKVFTFTGNEDAAEDLKLNCDKEAEDLKNERDIVGWINEKCSLDVSSVILPYLEHFISVDGPYMFFKAAKMYKFCKENDIHYIVARANTDRDSNAVLMAGKYMGAAKNLCVQHACYGTDAKSGPVFESETYDVTFTRDDMSQKYYSDVIEKTDGIACDFYQSAHYLKHIKKKGSIRRKNKEKENILYVEKKFQDHVRCLSGPSYSIAWYYEYQKKLIEYFARRMDFNFIYKHADSPGQKWARESTLLDLKEKNQGNMSVVGCHFLDALRMADRVIVDYPYGSLYESAVFGKPVLCLCSSYTVLQEDVKETFGKTLQQFSSFEEAVSMVEEFLNADPEKYKADVPFSDDLFIDVFRKNVLDKG